MNVRQVFLLVAAITVAPAGLSYGVVPATSLDLLFGVPVSDVNGTHIFRAIMGLYLGMVVFWVIGAFKDDLTRAALYSVVAFMFGLAAGRALSLVVDGLPSPLLVGYLGVEIAFGTVAVILLRRAD